MDDRTERLLNKAEEAIDEGDTERADAYRGLAAQHAYMRRKEAREMNRMLDHILDTAES